MSKKVLDIEGIKNELEGASLYFSRPSPPPASEPDVPSEPVQSLTPVPVAEPKVQSSRKAVSVSKSAVSPPTEKSNEETNEITNERIYVKPNKRAKIRHTFDIFADQLLSLRQISIDQEKIFGERVLLGDLAQQALDMFITKEKNK